MKLNRAMAGLVIAFLIAIAWGEVPATRDGGPATRPVETTATQGSGATTLPYGKPVTVKAAPGKMIEYQRAEQTIRAYSVTPEGHGPWPGVIVVHDIFGLTPWAKKQADELATQGYAVLVPDLYSREDAKEGTADAKLAWAWYDKMSDEQAVRDLRAGVTYLAASEAVGDGQPIGVVGYDMGGIYAMMLASVDLRIKAAVNYYGRVMYPQTTRLRPITPAELVTNLKAPMLCFYGEIDPQVPADHLQKLEGRLANNPNRVYFDIVKYPKVGHGFVVETRQGFNAEAAADSRKRTRDFLAKVLRAEPPKAEE